MLSLFEHVPSVLASFTLLHRIPEGGKSPYRRRQLFWHLFQRFQSEVIWLHGFWTRGQAEHHGEEHACSRAKQVVSCCQVSEGRQKEEPGIEYILHAYVSRNLLPFLDLPSEVSTASQSRLLIYKYLNLLVRSTPSWSSHLPQGSTVWTLLHWGQLLTLELLGIFRSQSTVPSKWKLQQTHTTPIVVVLI